MSSLHHMYVYVYACMHMQGFLLDNAEFLSIQVVHLIYVVVG